MASHPPGPSNTVRSYFSTSYRDQVKSAFQPFFEDNIDVALINIGQANLETYKLVVVPADYVMDTRSAEAIRNYVRNGGTVIMTAFSAKVDENSQWFDTPLPGRLSDVFGIRTPEFYRPDMSPEISLNGKTVQASINFYEVLEPRTAKSMALFTNTSENSPAITVNDYGNGHAIYVAVRADVCARFSRTQHVRKPRHREGSRNSYGSLRTGGGRTHALCEYHGRREGYPDSRQQARHHQRYSV